jgi:hypothetical protein
MVAIGRVVDDATSSSNRTSAGCRRSEDRKPLVAVTQAREITGPGHLSTLAPSPCSCLSFPDRNRGQLLPPLALTVTASSRLSRSR